VPARAISPERASDGVRHHSGTRALAQRAREQPLDEQSLLLGGTRRQGGQRLLASGRRPKPTGSLDSIDRVVDVDHRQARLAGRR
jgi:hypothetical protein